MFQTVAHADAVLGCGADLAEHVPLRSVREAAFFFYGVIFLKFS